MSKRLSWERDGTDWPNRGASRFVKVAGLRFHVQVLGEAKGHRDVALLLHGTGASSHSFADLAPHLARHVKVVVPDLPGHGFTEVPAYADLTLPAMATSLAGLLDELDVQPRLVVGHSAGAAILARMVLDGLIDPKLLVSLNGAILPLHGVQGLMFAPLANLFIKSGFMSKFFAWRARHTGLVKDLMRGTGSVIPESYLAFYGKLAESSAHVDAAIGMMANWDLKSLEPDLPSLDTQVLMVTGGNDRMIAPNQSLRLRRILPNARLELLSDLGHLAHEEASDLVGDLILDAWRKAKDA